MKINLNSILQDFRGFRIIATSILPIDGSTLVFGSADAGETIKDESPELREKIQKIAKKFNLVNKIISYFCSLFFLKLIKETSSCRKCCCSYSNRSGRT